MPLDIIIFPLCALGLGVIMTRFMIGVRIVDRPNARSSHEGVVPRTGGIAMAIAFFVIWTIAASAMPDAVTAARIGQGGVAAFAATALAVFVLSLLDDIWGAPPLAKLGLQVAAALAFAFLVAGVARLDLPGDPALPLGYWGGLAAVLWIVFFMNAFNFMDGINGVAGGSAIIACLTLALAGASTGQSFLVLTNLILVSAILGFLVFNFPAGRIFMGDSGSQFLGFVIAGLAVWAAGPGPAHVPIYLVPMAFAPFIFDVLVTLGYRARLKRNLLSAHNEHLYQIATKLGWSHAQVASAYFVLAVIGAALGLRADAMGLAASLLALMFYLMGLSAVAAWIYRTGFRSGVADRPSGTSAS